MPAHAAAHDVGVKLGSSGLPITQIDVDTNAEADWRLVTMWSTLLP